MENFEEKYCDLRNREKTKSRNGDKIIIPVVFHIIHNNGPENISDEQILQGLEYLNEAFANSAHFNNENGVNTNIQFCLAQRDEQGNAFSGISRYQSPYTDMSIIEGYEYIKSIQFDPDNYLNIQVVKNACLGTDCDVAGFGGQNRLVVEAQYIGISVTNTALLIHEMGHALGLDHTFKGGCKNNDCLKDGDKVCDTPPDNRTFEHCFLPDNSCSSDEDDLSTNNPFRPLSLGGLGDRNDDHTNYMDYNFWECYDHFTQGQADRMHFFIHERYSSLLVSKVCLPPCTDPVTAFFELPDSVEIGTVLDIINKSINSNSFKWLINNNPVSANRDLSFTFQTQGLVKVSLRAFTPDTLCEDDIYSKNIKVYCPVTACIDYQIHDQYLVFEDCSENNITRRWTLLKGNSDTLFTSTDKKDSFYIKNIDFVRLCLEASGQFCSEIQCKYITIKTDGSEICDNEQDDDGDGLIDLFDTDCPCSKVAYQAQCHPECEIIPDSFPDIKMKMKWESEVLENSIFFSSDFQIYSDNDGDIQIISSQVADRYEMLTYYLDSVKLIKLNAVNGEITQSKIIRNDNIYSEFAISDPLRNGEKKFYFTQEDRLVAFNTNLDESFRSDSLFSNTQTPPAIADLNHDGIGEVFQNGILYNSNNGNILLKLPQGACNFGINFCISIPVIGDFLDSPGLEIAMGNRVYSIEINNNSDTIGNTYSEHLAPSMVTDGFTSAGDIDKDGQLDVIVVTDKYRDGGGIYVWNPRNSTLIASANSGEDGGVAFVGDIDGDCNPEIGMTFKNQLRLYKYDGSTSLKLFWQIQTSDRSGRTGVTMFDFNQDGKQELVYRDETFLRIIEGVAGSTLDSFSIVAPTGIEYPVIADIDNDGQAEILVTGHENDKNKTRIYCFESATTPWAPARSVWNQYAYNPTQVNDDLTIPRYQQNAAQPLQGTGHCPRETCSTPYNNFMVQATYRTQEGCYVWPELQQDLSISATSHCQGDSIEICFIAKSSDSTILSSGVMVSCYSPPWDNGTVMDTLRITQDTTCFLMPVISGLDSIMIVVNDEGGYYPPDFPNSNIAECDYTNNEFVLNLKGPDFSIDIIDYECKPDSLIFYIATDNVGLNTDIACIDGGCYFVSPLDGSSSPQQNLLEITAWCFEYDSITMTYLYRDTFRVVIPIPTGKTSMWWTINEGGFGPGLFSSDITGIFECNYSNNIDSISFDIEEKILDIGPDITKCETEVITLNAGSGFESYLWSDLTTDSIFSTSLPGCHYVEATDQCGRIYRDTVLFTIEDIDNLNFIHYLELCPDQKYPLNVAEVYDSIRWYPSNHIDCDTCFEISISSNTSFVLWAQAWKGECFTFDSTSIRTKPKIITQEYHDICGGNSFIYGDSVWNSSGNYLFPSNNCDSFIVFHLNFLNKDSVVIEQQLCNGDSIFFGDKWVKVAGNYIYTTTSSSGCDSITTLNLTVYPKKELFISDTICKGDSLLFSGKWYSIEGNYQVIYASQIGCDSIINLNLKIVDQKTELKYYSLCPEDSIHINGLWLKNSGQYNFDFQSVSGCDSLLIVNIDKVIKPENPQIEIDCEKLEYSVSVNADERWKIEWSNGDNSNITKYYKRTSGWVIMINKEGCNETYYFELPELPNPKILPGLSDTIISKIVPIDYIFSIDSTLWNINWIPEELMSCPTCFENTILIKENPTEITVEFQHISGCKYSKTFEVSVKENEIYIPNVFTPNNDGFNDNFFVSCLGCTSSYNLSIFDRWGEEVFHQENITFNDKSAGWNGSFKSKTGDNGVYVYLVEILNSKGERQVFSGDVLLLR